MSLARLTVLTALIGLFLGSIAACPVQAQMKVPPHSFEDVIATAEASETPILVEIYAPWCPYCQRMQETVYAHPSVREYLGETFTYVRLNSDTSGGSHQYRNRTFTTKQLASALGANGVPTTTFLKSDGTPIARQPGFIKRATFLKIIRYVGSGAYQEQSFQAFTSEQSE